MNKSVIALSVVILLGISCQTAPLADEQFQNLADNYIESLLALKPEWATSLGDHRYDGRLNDYSLQGVEAERRLTTAYLDSLKSVRVDGLSVTNRVDYEILLLNLRSTIFRLDTLREYAWNPLRYNVGGAIYSLIARDFAPLEDRLANVQARLEGIGAVIDAAKKNLRNPPRVHTETSIRQNEGAITLVRNELNRFVDQVPGIKKDFQPVQRKAVTLLREYGRWLRKSLLPRSKGSFRLGDARYRAKLRYVLASNLPQEVILDRAEADLQRTQDEMYATALPLFSTYFPNVTDSAKLANRRLVIRSVLGKLAEDRPTNETIIGLAKQDLGECTDFVQQHRLVTVPDEPVKVIVMPEFQRGVAVAYCDAAGPLERNDETFFSISPTPRNWSKKRVASFYREYNDYMLQDLTIHEAMPGHYLQLMHARDFDAPTNVRAVFSSGTFIEGWAVYAEQLMAGQGYGGPAVRMQQLKMQLRVIINAILDQKIHTQGMTKKQALALMVNEGFQEEGEAEGKWTRACLTSAQLSTYYVGNLEVREIRDAYRAKMGTQTDLKLMHDQMLSFGSPPPRLVRRLMGL